MTWKRYEGEVWWSHLGTLVALHGECSRLIALLVDLGRRADVDEILTIEEAPDGRLYYNLALCPVRLREVRGRLAGLVGLDPTSWRFVP